MRPRNGARDLILMRWGLVPSWAKEVAIDARMINARADMIAEKPAFRVAFRELRCLVHADGFYEWRAENGRKQPFRVGLRSGRPFAFAGPWERWTAPEAARGLVKGEAIETFTIVTTDANAKLRPIRKRVPVLLRPENFAPWLDTSIDPAAAARLLRAYAEDEIAFYRVTPHVNNVRNDDPACFAPLNAALAGPRVSTAS